MILVAFDTIFEQCSVAILKDGKVVYTDTLIGSRGQTEIILPMLDKALAQTTVQMCDVQAWCFNRGPGAFNGIRINTAVVQALATAYDSRCIGISSLNALAYMALSQQKFVDGTTITALIDARQNQVYVGEFVVKNNNVVAKQETHEYLMDYDSVISSDIVVGDGVDLIRTDAKKLHLRPDAGHIAHLAYADFIQGNTVLAQDALPVYLRNHAWKTLTQQLQNKN